MPLVDFNPKALTTGYKTDLVEFKGKEAFVMSPHTSFDNVDDAETVKKNITTILQELKNSIKPNITTDDDWDAFEYSHYVPKLLEDSNVIENVETARTLWGLRHALCYQLLIYTYYTSITNVFTTVELQKFKLGIFGSLTPTSDIDIGVQYAEKTNRTKTIGIIAYVVKTFEDAFLNLTEKYSLGYDIEPYADMMYLDDENGGLFYCDSTSFNETDLMQMMPAIGASIIRNVVQSQIDLKPDEVEDVRRFKEQKQNGGTVKSITKIVNEFTFSEILEYYKNLTLENTNKQIVLFSKILNNTEWVDKAKEQALAYMTVIYKDSRETYYAKVKKAETLLEKINLGRIAAIKDNDRLNLMIAIAEALVFRAESYVSPSTVMHVVRVLQGKEQLGSDETCKTLKIPKSKAQCALGKMGYVMSCLEQIGYLYRFDKTYCTKGVDHYDENKCIKKHNKYLPRLKDGLDRISTLENYSVPATGQEQAKGGKRNRLYSNSTYEIPSGTLQKSLHRIIERLPFRVRRSTQKLSKRVKTHRLKITSRQNKRRNIKYSKKLK